MGKGGQRAATQTELSQHMDKALQDFARQVHARPDDICLTEGDIGHSYAEVDAISDNLARDLTAAGVGVTDVVVWIGGAGANRLLAFLATQKAGMAFGAPIMQMGATFISDYFAVCQPRCVIFEKGWGDHVPADRRADAICFRPDATRRGALNFGPVSNDVISHLSFTSGSTGAPKGMARNRAAMAYFIREACRMQALGPDDTVALLGNLWNPTLFTGLVSGARTACFDTPQHGAASLADWLARERATATMTYPAIFRQIMVTGRPLPHLRNIILIGEPLTRADAEAHARCAAPDARLINIYGSMEFAYVTAYDRAAKDPISFDMMPLGRAAAPGVLRLLNDAGEEIAEDGVVGEIEVVSKHVVPGYLDEPELNKTRFAIRPDGVKTMKTGDLAYRDHAGVYHSMGRRDGRTKIRGYQVRPPEIELIVTSLDGVDEATIGAFPTPSGIARLVCHYVGEADGAALRAQLRQRLPDYMTPSLWIRLDELPKNAAGKIRRIDLPDPFAGPPKADGEDWSAAEARIRDMFSDILGVKDIKRADDFFDLGGDSLQAMRLLIELETAFGRRFPFERFILEGATIGGLAERVTSDATSPISILRPGDGGRTLIIGHSLGGHLAYFLEAAHLFDPRIRIVGANASGMAADEPVRDNFGDLAADALRRLGAEWRDAPKIAVLGYSFAGPLALEMARQIGAERGDAPPLALIDPLLQWNGRWDEVRYLANRLRRGQFITAARYGRRLLTPLSQSARSLDDAHLKAWRSYKAAGFNGSKSLIVCTDAETSAASAKRWRAVIKGEVDVQTAPGAHEDMIAEPNVGQLAQIIQKWMAGLP